MLRESIDKAQQALIDTKDDPALQREISAVLRALKAAQDKHGMALQRYDLEAMETPVITT